MERIQKEPIYKKWWAWVALFIIVATIVNSREEKNRQAALSSPNDYVYEDEIPLEIYETDYNYGSPEVISLCCTQDNIFLVGQDLEPGEYFIQAKEDTHAFVQVARDSSGSVGSVITNKIFKTHSFITVNEGEYLIVERAMLTSADEAIVPTFKDGVLGDGVYRVGIDIPAGHYTVQPTTDVAGYYQISTNSRGTASDIVSNNNFSDEITITVEEGQYLTLTRAQLIK